MGVRLQVYKNFHETETQLNSLTEACFWGLSDVHKCSCGLVALEKLKTIRGLDSCLSHQFGYFLPPTHACTAS